jgi:outer membrane receptor protein involved in Fe transport
MLAAAPAYAQGGQPTDCSTLPTQADRDACAAGTPPTTAAAATNEPGITVTGTRIRRPNLSSPVPITSVTAEELPNQGQANIGDALNDLPSIRSTFSQQNSGRFIGTAGENFLDLRGLGTSRTLVLVNGRRHITATPGDFDVDVNTIPQDLVERIDVVTGGEAAIYGSDAVAGVINFVLKRDFDGIRLRAQDGVSQRGDRGIQFATLTAGRNFADGRGNIAVSGEYLKAAPLYLRDRDALTGAYSGRCQFQLVQNTTGEPQAGDGVPDSQFLCGIKNATLSDGGTIGQVNAAGDFLRFDNSGNLFIDHPTQSFVPIGSGNQQGGAGSTLRNTGQLAVGQTRYTGNILAHFDVSNALRFFVEAKYVRQTVLQEGQPSFFQGTSTLGSGSRLHCDNPFLTAQARLALVNTGASPGASTAACARQTAAVAATPTTPAIPAAFVLDANGNRIFDPTRTFTMSRFNIDFGGRKEVDRRETFRIVGGIEGDFNNNWHYELSGNYGRFQSTNREENDLRLFDLNGNPDGFFLALDAVRNAAGQIVCRVNQVTVTRPDCVPLNVFGNGQPSQAALNFVNTTSFVYSQASELDILAFISGDSQQLFSLPGGPIGFSLGAEYRRETADQHADPLSAASGTFFNAFSPFHPPAFDVKEVFGELNLPILKDMTFAHELTISGAARYSDYNTSAGNTFAWNVNGVYSPVSDIRLRANYSKSVRVPTLSDLYSVPSVNFNFVTDPCDSTAINNGANRKANCAALGVPTTVLAGSPCVTTTTPVGSPFRNCVANSQTIQILSGGNPSLKAETGKSLTIGGVLTPRFLPGFSLTIDYFNIKVTNLISVLSAQAILNQCVDQSTIGNQFCALINPRDQFGLLASPALLSSGVNFAKQTSRGVDIDMSYRHTFAGGVRVNARGIGTYTLERNNFVNPVDPTFIDRQLSELGDPIFSASLQLGIGQGPWDISYTMRYIGRQTVSTYEATHTLQGRPPTNPDVTSVRYYPDVFYHDIRASVKVNNKFRWYLGVDNLFDRMPPLGLLGTEAGSPYSSIGRFFYSGVQVDF